jgi:hypothetical protein
MAAPLGGDKALNLRRGFLSPYQTGGYLGPGRIWIGVPLVTALPVVTNFHVMTAASPVARGFIPDGLRSSPKTIHRRPHAQVLRLLRSPSGINPLATGSYDP